MRGGDSYFREGPFKQPYPTVGGDQSNAAPGGAQQFDPGEGSTRGMWNLSNKLNPGWLNRRIGSKAGFENFERGARPSTNIEDVRGRGGNPIENKDVLSLNSQQGPSGPGWRPTTPQPWMYPKGDIPAYTPPNASNRGTDVLRDMDPKDLNELLDQLNN
jgi:hypothetical protein